MGYLVGSIPAASLTVRALAGEDVRRYGTGNPGTSNVYRNFGWAMAILVAAETLLQGFLPPLAARLLNLPRGAVVAAGLGAVVGYCWPFFSRFRGGRAVACATGAVASMFLIAPLVALLVYYLFGLATRRIALGVLVGFALLPVAVVLVDPYPADRVAAAVLLGLIALKRLDGIWADPDQIPIKRRIWDRLVFDTVRGQSLTGVRTHGSGPA